MHAEHECRHDLFESRVILIIVTTAATLGAHGRANMATAQQAAQALRPLAGAFAELLFDLSFSTEHVGRAGARNFIGVRCGADAPLSRGIERMVTRAPRFYLIIMAGV